MAEKTLERYNHELIVQLEGVKWKAARVGRGNTTLGKAIMGANVGQIKA